MKKALKLTAKLVALATLIVALAFFFDPFAGVNKEKPDERLELLELRGAFRRAFAVVEATCIKSYASAQGFDCSDYIAERIIAGGKGLGKGSVFTVIGADIVGSKRLLYLGETVDNVHSENENVYSTVTGALPIVDDELILSGERAVSLSALDDEIAELQGEKMIPSKFFYYSDLKSLIGGSASIFIGRIENIEHIDGASLYANDRGELIHRNEDVKALSVSVLNGLAWRNAYGDRVRIDIIDSANGNLFDARTNEHFDAAAGGFVPSVGDICVFFVIDSPDEKGDALFLVNNIQGIIKTDGDAVFPNNANLPLREMSGLSELVNALYSAIGFDIFLNY